jgi:hypothetical protein
MPTRRWPATKRSRGSAPHRTAPLDNPGEVGFFTSGGATIIRASNDADATTEFEIQLTGIKTLTLTDFFL